MLKTISEAQLAAALWTINYGARPNTEPDEECLNEAAAIFAALPDTGLELTTAVVNPLDVERLAREFHDLWGWCETEPCPPDSSCRRAAEVLYASLTEGQK